VNDDELTLSLATLDKCRRSYAPANRQFSYAAYAARILASQVAQRLVVLMVGASLEEPGWSASNDINARRRAFSELLNSLRAAATRYFTMYLLCKIKARESERFN
jgi:hypothetical protein